MATDGELRTVDSPEALAALGAELVLSRLAAAIAERGRARWVLAGGATPLRLYRLLASRPEAIDWERVVFFWGDERCVPPADAASNYGMAREALLDPLGVAPAQRVRIRGELPPVEAAAQYDAVVDEALAEGDWDLVLLGLGADGHTASLFPPRGPEPKAWTTVTEAPLPPVARVSLTLGALNRARQVLFLVAGSGKAEALARVRAGDSALHASSVAPLDGQVDWYVDRAAADEPAAVQSAPEPEREPERKNK